VVVAGHRGDVADLAAEARGDSGDDRDHDAVVVVRSDVAVDPAVDVVGLGV
jgi:hypothetical protein